jgi:membrane fusion protein (multidrug efflux system)
MRFNLRKNIMILLPVLVIVLIIIILTIRVRERKRIQALEATKKTEKIQPVKVLETHYMDIMRFVKSSGVVHAWEEAIISSEVSGKVQAIYAKTGDRLEQGASILKLDDEMLGYAVEQAEANIMQLEGNYEASKKDLQRKRGLFDDKVISELEFDLAKAKEKVDRGLLDAARASLKIAKRDLRETLIESPISGILAERLVDIGTDVSKGAKVATVVSIDKIKIKVGISESEIAEIQEGQPVRVEADAFPEKIFHGKVYSVGMKADDETLTFPVEASVVNSSRPILKPGMVARIAIQSGNHSAVIALPQDLLFSLADKTFVWVVQDGVAKKTEVTPGPIIDSRIIIKAGLQPGDPVVIAGQQGLFEGSKVKIRE